MTSTNTEVDVPDHSHEDLETNIEELAENVIGPKKSDFLGGGRYEEQGLVHKVDLLLEQGIRVKLPWQLWVAIITALGGLAVQLVETLAS